MNLTLAEEIEQLRAENAMLKAIVWPPAEGFRLEGEGAFQRLQSQILHILHRHFGQMVRYEAIYNGVYGLRSPCDQPCDDVIKVQVCKIRKRLRHHRIENERNVGYRLVKVAA